MQTSTYFTPIRSHYVANDGARMPLFSRGGQKPAFYAQDYLPDEQLLGQRLVLRTKLGAGGFGTAYSCLVDGNPYVVKIPNALLEARDVIILHDGHIQMRAEELRQCTPKKRALAEQDAYREFAIAEMVMDTPAMRKAYHHREFPGTRVRRLTPEEYEDHCYQQKLMRAHPGFEHLLRMVHLCPSVPCLLMEQCDGSSQDMYDANELFSLKEVFASHVLMGMEFLRDVAGLANTDLKFDNVMYRRRTGDRYTFVIVDYGGCGRIDRPWAENCVSTRSFGPPRRPADVDNTDLPLWDPATIDPLSVSVYAFAAMLLYLYCRTCQPYRSDSCALELTHYAPRFGAQDPVLSHVLDLLCAPPESILERLPALRVLFEGEIAPEQPHFEPNHLGEDARLRDPAFFAPHAQ